MEAEFRPFVDSAPGLERPLPAKARLGWIGNLNRAIQEAFRPLIGNRIYGGDDHPLICPWRGLRNVTVALGNAPWSTSNVETLQARRGESSMLDEYIEWALACQLAKRSENAVEVQSGQQKRLERAIEKGYRVMLK